MLSGADLLEWTLSERKNINREWASLFITHTHSLGRMSERGEALSSEREKTICWRSSLCFWVLLLPLVLILSLRKLRGFLLYGFPDENSLCLLSLVFIDVHVILSYKILRSYCLNDKNLAAASGDDWAERSPLGVCPPFANYPGSKLFVIYL